MGTRKKSAKQLKDEEAILKFLAGRDWTSQSVIGGMEGPGGKDYQNSSSWASRRCKKLVEDGFLERSVGGHYRVKMEMRGSCWKPRIPVPRDGHSEPCDNAKPNLHEQAVCSDCKWWRSEGED